MIVDASGFYAGFMGDVAHRRRVIAIVPKKSGRRSEDVPARPFGLAQLIFCFIDHIKPLYHPLSIVVVHKDVHCNKSNKR